MRRSPWRGLALFLGLCLAWPAGAADTAGLRIAVASTAVETGVIDRLIIAFRNHHPEITVTTLSAGAELTLGRAREGAADLVITHAPMAEQLFVANGYGKLRTEIMYDEFALLGPPADPLHLARNPDLVEVLRTIAAHEVPFMVPAPQSGTFKKIEELWDLAGIKPDWIGYESTGESAAATLVQAAQFGAYTIVDLGTYLARRPQLDGALIPLYRDHPALRNIYSAIVVNAATVPGANERNARRFLDFLVSDEAQRLIGEFGERRYGTALFVPAAQFDENLAARRAADTVARDRLVIQRLGLLAAALLAATLVAVTLAIKFRRAERARRTSEERFMLAVTGTSDGIWDWNMETGETFYSKRWREMLGYRGYDDEIDDTIRAWQDRIHYEEQEQTLARLDRYLAGHSDYFSADHRIRTKSGGYLWVQVRGKALWDDNGKPLRMAGSMTDISERKHQEEALAHQALHDPLTNLPNRTLLHERLRVNLASARSEHKHLAVVMFDLDDFKDVNDTLGHPSGDIVLQHVAQRLLLGRMETDTVARFGADRYTLILPGADTDRAKLAIREIGKRLDRPIDVDGQQLAVRASIGVAIFPEHGEDDVVLLQRAEVALFRAKRAQTGYAIYDGDLDQHGQRYLAFGRELQQATERGELILHYQPMMNLHTGYYTAIEALVRWRHPKHGLIGPEAFIPRAEDSALIKIPTFWILEEALRSCAHWQAAGKRLTVAVNLSAGHLHDPHLPEQVAALLTRLKVPGHWLELEITESAIMTEPARAREILHGLRAMGVQIVIDDFGTGYSSLSYLKDLPADKIKIDKAFVTALVSDDSDAAIVRAAIALAHDLGLKVIAEGVENEDSLRALVRLRCDIAQGYHICHPLGEDEFARWLIDAGPEIEAVGATLNV